MRPYTLPPNVLRHFYAGGERIAALRGTEPADHTPEEWIGAANTTFDGSRGLSRLPDGRLLRDALEADPEAFLGPAHARRFGADPALLVKLLDAGQRLPVHFHPGREFAARELGLAHGKTEAWLIVEADPGASVHVGFAREVALDEVRGWMEAQDSGAMLGAMQELPVTAGDAVFVPAGVPHAIGAGILMVEVQEPTDLSVLLEWEGFELTEENGRALYVPVGFAHGFCVLSDVADVTYKVSSYYDAETESGIAWNDPEVGVEWPVADPQTSERDTNAPRLSAIAEQLPFELS